MPQHCRSHSDCRPNPYAATDTEFMGRAATCTSLYPRSTSSCGLTSKYFDILQPSSVFLQCDVSICQPNR